MRHIVLALMIALLPLRGWVGDAMAGQMLQQQLVAVNSDASAEGAGQSGARSDAYAESSAMPHCDEHAATPAPAVALHDTAPEGDMSASDCATCSSCQVCHSFVLALPMAAAALTAHQHAAPALQGEKFASAEAVQGFKPPIL